MRLIDADALKKEAERLIRCEVEDGRERFYRINAVEVAAINIAPTIDAVPVVRCKDCKYMLMLDGNRIPLCSAELGFRPLIHNVETWYCPLGKKKDGGTEDA